MQYQDLGYKDHEHYLGYQLGRVIFMLLHPRGSIIITDLAMLIGKYDRFVISGKRLNLYENAEVNKSMKNINEDIYALNVEFNQYYNMFVVLTK